MVGDEDDVYEVHRQEEVDCDHLSYIYHINGSITCADCGKSMIEFF
jgi:hypothetical protein